jgi:uncharacterized membrane protein YvbJ
MANDQTMRLRSQIHNTNVHKRGNVKTSLIKKEDIIEWGPIILAVVLIIIYRVGCYHLKYGTPSDL